MSEIVVCRWCGGVGDVDVGSYYAPEVMPCGVCGGTGELDSEVKVSLDPILGQPMRLRPESEQIDF